MLVATWNINGLRARLDYLLAWLAERRPDVVGLQEIKITDEAFPAEAFQELGYHVATHGQKAWNGVAILSRTPITVTQTGLPGQEAFGARLITATIGGGDGHGDLSFTTVYVPNGKELDHPDFPRKLAWLDDLAEHLEASLPTQQRAIVCGDFNLCPTALDSWGGEAFAGRIFHTVEERLSFRRLASPPCDLVDLYRQAFPHTQAFSWWDYRGGSFPKGQGLRLDFLLGTPAVAAALSSVTIDREYRKKRDGMTPSDHAPVMAEI